MKLKIYLRMLLAAVAALFVTTGCSDSNDDKGDGPTPPPDKSLTFDIGVSGIDKDQAKLAVTPSDQTATYYYNAVKKSIYDGLGSDKAFLEDDLEFLRSEAAKESMTLEAYLQSKTSRGTATYTLTGLEKETEYYAYVYGLKTDGTITSDLTKSLFTSGEGADEPDPGEAPKFKEFYLQPGDPNGEDSDSKITMTVSATTTVTHGKFYANKKAVVEQALAEGLTYAQIIKEYGEDLDAEAIDIINEGGLLYTLSGFDPQTDYTFICMIGNEDGEVMTNDNVATNASDDASDGPKLLLTMRLGDHKRENTDTHVVINMAAAGTTSGKYGLFTKSSIDAALAEGETYETIIKNEKNGSVMIDKYITAIADKGLSLSISGLTPSTAYTAIVMVANEEGNDTVKAVTATTTGDGTGTVDPEDGPELEVSLQAGDADGINKDSEMYMSAFAPDAVSSMYGLFATTDVENAIAGGASLDAIVTQSGDEMTAEWLSFLTKEPGIGVTLSGLDMKTSYTAIVKVTDADGKSTTKSAVGSTEGELVPSTVELKNLAQGEMGYYGDAYGLPENDYANWTIYLADETVDLSNLSGTGEVMMIELNTAKNVTTEITPGTYNVMPDRFGPSFVAFTCVPGYLGENGSPYGTWYIKDKSAKYKALSGTVVVAKSGENYTFTFELVDTSTATTMKGTYTGPMEYIDYTKPKAPAKAPWKNAANSPRKSIDARNIVMSTHGVTTVSNIGKMMLVSVEAPTSFEVQTSGIEFTPSVAKMEGYTPKVRSVRNE